LQDVQRDKVRYLLNPFPYNNYLLLHPGKAAKNLHQKDPFQKDTSVASDPAHPSDAVVNVPDKDGDDEEALDLPFPVVGVGASAGGLEAFSELLSHLQAEPGLAILFVLHLEPYHKSHLAEVLARVTSMPIEEATDGKKIESGHVYVIPPNTNLALADGHLSLSARSPVRGLHMPIDHLFRSLANVQKSKAVGVLLSGGGTDGVIGFQAIKAEGGITFAQDEKSARQSSMPQSAANDGNVDYVLPPKEIAEQLARLSRHPYTQESGASRRQLADAADALNEIIGLLRSSMGVDFTNYKRPTLKRRIERRMALRGFERVGDYIQFLRGDIAELNDLYRDFLIRVTQFFRDPEAFEALKEQVYPKLVLGRAANSTIRVWSVGCATGEEVYSLAISLVEFLQTQPVAFPVKILATDLNETALEKARTGLYLDNIEIDVTPERLRRFFVKTGNHYQINQAVRDLCVFSRHDLATDPPFSQLDLVSCRNLLIYMNSSLQKRVLPILHYALSSDRFLLLGSSESVGAMSDLFEPVNPRQRIYVKKYSSMPAGMDFGIFRGNDAAKVARVAGEATAPWSALDVQREADRIVLNRYAPVGVVVDEVATVVQFRGRTLPYLEPAPGMASLDLMRMLREGLLADVRAAFREAKLGNLSVTKENLIVREEDRLRQVRVEIIPFKVAPSGVRFFLVLFEDVPGTRQEAPPKAASPDGADEQVSRLEQELSAVREYLQAVIEEHETTNEELKLANEEILSANEELQSTNEELQTAKEEAQSANEELGTVNEELRHRNAALTRVNNDLINLLAGVNIPIVMVSRDLHVRRFTPQAEKLFNLIPTDVGRPISDLKPNLEVRDLPERITAVIDTLTPYEGTIRDNTGRSYSLRIRPYVTMENMIDGASIVLLEVDPILRSLSQDKPAEDAR
jgi:two-component system CheB/CheR fusion protein